MVLRPQSESVVGGLPPPVRRARKYLRRPCPGRRQRNPATRQTMITGRSVANRRRESDDAIRWCANVHGTSCTASLAWASLLMHECMTRPEAATNCSVCESTCAGVPAEAAQVARHTVQLDRPPRRPCRLLRVSVPPAPLMPLGLARRTARPIGQASRSYGWKSASSGWRG